MTTELQQLKASIDAIHPLPVQEWEAFAGSWRIKSTGKKQTLTVAGSKESFLYFVREGVQRIFYLDDEGRESTLLFTYAPSFGGVIDSLLLQQPSRYYYETLTPSVFLQLPERQLYSLMQQHAQVEVFVRKALILSLSGVLERLTELQVCTAQEKFKRLLQRSPHILQLVPQKYLASYLGIDATNFSKLMNTVRI